MAIFDALQFTSKPDSSFCPIAQDKQPKTLDIGLNGSTVSTGPLGDILQLSTSHPKHGVVTVSPFEQFDGARFNDPEYVRAYRSRMLDYVRSEKRGFGIQFSGKVEDLRTGFLENRSIRCSYLIGDMSVETTQYVCESGEVVQSARVTNISTTSSTLKYSFDLNVSVNRASYGQLTEGGPIPIPPSENDLSLLDNGNRYAILNSHLETILDGNLTLDGKPIQLNRGLRDSVFKGEPVRAKFFDQLRLDPGVRVSFISAFRLRPSVHSIPIQDIPRQQSIGSRGQWKLKNNEASLIVKRNLEYILGNCTIPISDEAVCFITDHVALPLGWNRDNYWQIRFLLDVYRNISRLMHPGTARAYEALIKKNVRGHLKWVFHLAQRPHGYWHRSYLATGIPKDGPVFQQDQQCYPLLEVCDYFNAFPEDSGFVRTLLNEDTIPDILEMLSARRDRETGLYATEETPGDDAVEYPFHFSSHVLVWHTIQQLAITVTKLGDTDRLRQASLRKLADSIREATLQHFIAKNTITGRAEFAYLTDGAGHFTFYHDANDIPTLFSLDWGFLSASHIDIWHNTMNFGMSPANKDGYYPNGTFGGLGSVHTRAPWPLGYAQELVYAELRGNDVARDDAWRRIKGTMFWDGLFSEAVDGETGKCTSKAWFSWPGSMIGSALLRFGMMESEK